MKKLLALILVLLMTILIFASCDTGGEEVSSDPVSEVSSVEVSSENGLEFVETVETDAAYSVQHYKNSEISIYLVTFQNDDGTTFLISQLQSEPSVFLESDKCYRIVGRDANGDAIIRFYNTQTKKCSPTYLSNHSAQSLEDWILLHDNDGFYVADLYSGAILAKYPVDLTGVDAFISAERTEQTISIVYVGADGASRKEVIIEVEKG